FELYFGEYSARNRMEVNGGGQVVSSNTYIGYSNTNNLALVTGAGSLWSNRGDLYVGHSSSGNLFVVSNGGAIRLIGDAIVGLNNSAVSNSMVLTDAGTSLNGLNTD